MKLTKQQFLEIQSALLDGYDRAGLRRLIRLGLDTSLDEITSGRTDSDVVFDVIEWAERYDKVPVLIDAAVEFNSQNEALQQLKQDSSVWFTSEKSAASDPIPHAADSSPVPTVAPPPDRGGGDVIIATIGSDSENIVVGKNIYQSGEDSKRRTQK